MDHNLFVEIGIALTGGISSTFLGILSRELVRLRLSVESLNEKMATIVERTNNHEHRLNKLERTH